MKCWVKWRVGVRGAGGERRMCGGGYRFGTGGGRCRWSVEWDYIGGVL